MQCIDGVKGLAGVSWVVANATEYYAAAGALVNTTKIMESVYMYVCPAMRFAMLWGIELKLGMGVGDGPTRFVGIFSKWPHLGLKVIQGSICLKMPYGYQIWWEEPLTKAQCIAGVKGHAEVNRGQPGVKLLRNALWPPNVGGKNPWPKHNALLGSKVM